VEAHLPDGVVALIVAADQRAHRVAQQRVVPILAPQLRSRSVHNMRAV
jgi:hypothetical protein